jgi:ribosomal protein S12 methylthiotransferase accessory factor
VERLILRDVAAAPLTHTMPMLQSLASPLTGIIPFTQQLLPVTDDARLFHVASVTCDTEALIGSAANRYNGGINFTYAGALAAAIGEGLERYAGAYLDESRVRIASADELGAAAAPAASFALFHSHQYAQPAFTYAPFTPQTRVRWTPAFRLPGGEPAFVPTQLIHLGRPLHDEAHLGYATSSGMACAASFEEAILSGLFELVERDAFMLTWNNRLSLPLVDSSGEADIVDDDRRYYRSTGLRYHAVDLSVFHAIPTALGVVRDDAGEIAFAVGCASAATMRDAVRKALREAFQTRTFARQLRSDDPDWDKPADRIESFEDHVLYHSLAHNAPAAAFVDRSPARVRVAEVAALGVDGVTARILAIVDRLARAGVDTYAVDTTPPDLRAAGLRTAAVVAPQLCRLDVPVRFRYLGGERLYRAAHERGLLARVQTIDDLNSFPHPFP